MLIRLKVVPVTNS